MSVYSNFLERELATLRARVAELEADNANWLAIARANESAANQSGVHFNRATAAESELDKWRNWHPDEETLADARRQAFMPNGDHSGSLAAMVVYVRVLEERIRRNESALAAVPNATGAQSGREG